MSDLPDPSLRKDEPTSSAVGSTFKRVATGLITTALAVFLAVVMLVGIGLSAAFPNLPEIDGLMDYRPRLPLRVLSSDGVILGEFGEEKRIFTPIGDIPKSVKDAVLAIEDSRFYEHGGVDYLGIIRAGLANLTDSRSQGASTITMQVARNFYLSSEKTFTRKIYEILLSMKIERQLSKDQILELYMNQIFLGQRAYGFAAASEIYFGKPIKQLSIAEAAMLAGLPKAPSAYNPISNPKRAVIRQQHIIDQMLENGFITRQEHEQAKAEKLRYRRANTVPTHGEFAAEAARQLIHAHYGDETYTRGLNVFLTIDSKDQEVAYRALRRGVLDFERRQAYRGPEGFLNLPGQDSELDAKVAEKLQEHPDLGDLRAAVVLDANAKAVKAMLADGTVIEVSGDGLRSVQSGLGNKGNPQVQIRRGSVVRALASKDQKWALMHLPDVESALVALDPQTGAVRAMVGGFDFAKNKFNHVTQAWRQPGSSFKPFIYSAAVEAGLSGATIINDSPLFFDAGATGSQPWSPKNYDGKYEGPMTARRALAKSKNLPAVRVMQKVGPAEAQQWIARFGFDADKHPAYLTTALGAGAVTPMQMAAAYGVFANGGRLVSPVLVAKVTDDKGKVLNAAKIQAASVERQVIDPRNAFVMHSLLQEVTRSGTAAKAGATLKRSDLAGKTGTTNDAMDAWFAGYHPHLVAVVWMGYDNPRKLGERETGGALSLPIWIEFMQHALAGLGEVELTPPIGLTQIGGEWFYDEFKPGSGAIASLGGGGGGGGSSESVPEPASEEEKKKILDLFD